MNEEFEANTFKCLRDLHQCSLCQHLKNMYPCSSECRVHMAINTYCHENDNNIICPAFLIDPSKIQVITDKLEEYKKLDTLKEILSKSDIQV